MKSVSTDYRSFLREEDTIAMFLRAMAKFDRAFCDAISSKEDFTLRMEVHGNQGELLHVRVINDGFERPSGVKGKDDRVRNYP